MTIDERSAFVQEIKTVHATQLENRQQFPFGDFSNDQVSKSQLVWVWVGH